MIKIRPDITALLVAVMLQGGRDVHNKALPEKG